MLRSSNPALNNSAFEPAQTWDDFETKQGGLDAMATQGAARVKPVTSGAHMSIQGTVQKTAFLLLIVMGVSAATWQMVSAGTIPLMGAWLVGIFGSLGVGLVISFVPKTAPVLAPVYAVLEGAFVGAFSLWIASFVGGKMGENSPDLAIVFNAAMITFGITGGLLIAYATKLIRPNRTFYNVTIAATFGVCIYAVIALVAGLFFGNYSMASVYDPGNGGLISIGFSLFVILLASANLVMDFDIVANGVDNRAPKFMEWYGGFAIMVSLVWLYINVLRLLAKLQSRD